MTVYAQPLNPRRLDADDLVDALQSSRQMAASVSDRVAAAGVVTQLSPIGATSTLAEGVADQDGIRQSFFAEIAPRGPGRNPNHEPFNKHNPADPGPADHTDSRYWVREVLDASGRTPGDDAGVNFRRFDHWRHTLVGAEIVADLDQQFRFRWLTATNIAEVGVGGEGHALPVGQIVRVYRGTNPAGRVFYWFSHSAGSAMRFGVVRDTFNASTQHDIVMMQSVSRKPVTPDTPPDALAEYEFETNDDGTPATGPVAVWPHLRAAHYEGFRYGGPTMVPRVQVLPVVRTEGIWYVQQMPRWAIHKLPISARITDCSLVSFFGGFFGRRS